MDPQTSAQSVVVAVGDAGVAAALEVALGGIDVSLRFTDNGASAARLVDADTTAVVISQTQLPDTSGVELLAGVAARHHFVRGLLLGDATDLALLVAAAGDGRAHGYLVQPWDDAELRQRLAQSLESVRLARDNARLQAQMQARNAELEALNASLDVRVAVRTAELEHTAARLSAAIDDLNGSHETMIRLLANLAELRDPEAGRDGNAKLTLALATAVELGLDEASQRALRHAVLLHRIGRMALSDEVLTTPTRRLSQTQRSAYELHPVHAEALLLGIPRMVRTSAILRAQHERWDAAGYPDRIGRNQIPPGARILAVVRDFFDLQRGLLLDDALTPARALAAVCDDSGRRYDPDVVAAMERVLPHASDVDVRRVERRMAATALRPGMRLARDLVTAQGILLLNQDYELTRSIIDRIVNIARLDEAGLEVFVRDIASAAESDAA